MTARSGVRWMLFVDGENFTLRAQALARASGLNLEVDPVNYVQDVFVWIPGWTTESIFAQAFHPHGQSIEALRAYYYTSVVGDEPKVISVREALRGLKFAPQVFKKASGTVKSKGVDITLTKDMLSHAFLDNYDMAVLIAGDADYLPLVEEVKRRGKTVGVGFFTGPGLGLAQEIPLIADRFFDLTRPFVDTWANRIQGLGRRS